MVKWSPRLTFLGTVITQRGNDYETIRARLKRVMRAFQILSPMLTNKALPVAARVSAFIASVLSSFCSQAQNGTPTKNTVQLHQQVVCPASDQPCAESEDAGMNPWTRGGDDSTKTERSSGQRTRMDVISAVEIAKFRNTGHIARMQEADIVHRALKSVPPNMVEGSTGQDSHKPRTPRPHDS